LLEPLVQPGTDLLGRQMRSLPLIAGDDDTCCRDTGQTGQPDSLPKVHKQETFRE